MAAKKDEERKMTFILRLVNIDETGRVAGVVERVKTGEKQRFDGIEAISPLIARMVKEEKDHATDQP
jgi:hypothetical protein